MEAQCLTPGCGFTTTIRHTRGARVTDHKCPRCGDPLVATTAARSRGHYLCPIGGYIVTLGHTGMRLTEPSEVVWVPGWIPTSVPAYAGAPHPRTHLNTPDQATDFLLRHKVTYLEAAQGKVFGPGCVVGRDSLDTPGVLESTGMAGVCLRPAPDTDPTTWIVNTKLVYRRCAACGAPTAVLPDTLMPAPWKPARQFVLRGRGRLGRHREPVSAGPHPAGTVRCADCGQSPY